MRIRTILAVIVAVAAVFAGIAAFAGDDHDPTNGPLDAAGLFYNAPVDVNQAFSSGLTILHNLGRRDAVVERVRLLGVVGPLNLLGVRVRPFPLGNNGMLLGDFGFPPANFPAEFLNKTNGTVPVPKNFASDGYPEDGLQLVIGVTATNPGIAAYRDVEVTYRVGKRRYTEVYTSSVQLCAPASEYVGTDKPCPPDELNEKFGDRTLG